ncbi:MAG TPA: GDSL-type esterase/lipase family protein [Dysgonomonas sp.]|uniref:GDSL-type esterase/lipase family protein n=1 Tax=unclassified Dysgonomonas TaxID=2630389 RepID=UPI0025C31576|nr:MULTISPECIES: GDSL-type esterase/lipase family protein [unclassified Dysgonomonas]HML63975.1 GDSL-type esterase/lipase family protein [Dysgonomonas sp.]
MRTILSILMLFCTMILSAQEIQENILENKTYLERMAYFKANPLTNGQIIFLGNSLTQGGKWNEYFPNQKPVNRGISGDNTLGMLNRLNEIIIAKPKKVFLMAGINDISLSRSNEKIMIGIKSIIYQIETGSPYTKIYVQSLLPINNNRNVYQRMLNKEWQIEQLNKELKAFCEKENITFINIYPAFLSEDRTLDTRYTTDGLHLNDNGYTVWVDQIRKYVEE